MRKETKNIPGDTPGQEWQLKVLHFDGNDPQAPTAYLQAALHGAELPGVAALHFLIPMLQQAETEGRLAGKVTIVPFANPIGLSQYLNSQHLGRFDFYSRTNFNRDHALLKDFDTSGLPVLDAPVAQDRRLKAELMRMALAHEIILDLHCDDEGENYVYLHESFWPDMADLTEALGCTGVLLWNDPRDAAFDEACAHPIISNVPGRYDMKRRAVTTVEFRGVADVSPELAKSDASGLMRFLTHRGVVKGESGLKGEILAKNVTPLANVEILRAPVGGMLLFNVKPGDEVVEGQTLATIVFEPGDPEGSVTLFAPQAGFILTRRSHRFIRRGEDVLKLLGTKPSASAKKPGALEA